MIFNYKNLTIDCIKKSKISNKNKYLDLQTEREQHLKFCLEKIHKEGQILEFGVFEGTTINIIAEKFYNEIVWGFDSFEGLPEDWVTINSEKIKFPKGHFKLEVLPKVKNNVKLIKGWFNETIPKWKKNNKKSIKLLHIDCDLYSSTKDVLFMLNDLIVSETLIIFDEIYHWKDKKKYAKWKDGEFKALFEWMKEFDRKIIPVCRSRYMQCCIKVL